MEFDSSFLPVLIITLAAFVSSMVTAIVGAGGGTALLLLMLYMVPAGNVVAVHGCIQLVSNFARVAMFWRHMHWPVIVRFVIPMPAGVYLGLQIYEMMDHDGLQLVIASFVLLSLVIRPPSSPEARGLPKGIYYVTGFFIGAANIIVGVLSPILGAILRLERLPKEQLVGTLGFSDLPAMSSRSPGSPLSALPSPPMRSWWPAPRLPRSREHMPASGFLPASRAGHSPSPSRSCWGPWPQG